MKIKYEHRLKINSAFDVMEIDHEIDISSKYIS